MPYVYALGDPRTGKIRYIGITSNLYQRYAQHLLRTHNLGNLEWIGELRSLDILPTLTVLESGVDESIIFEREKHWIEYYSQQGMELTNSIVPRSVRKRRNEGYYMMDEVATFLGVSERTLFKLIKEGKLTGSQVGREWRFDESDIDAYIVAQRQKAKEELEYRQAREKRQTDA